jgi:hypothetical protein
MSTSHYSNRPYEPINEDIRKAAPSWQEPLSHPSLSHSRPEAVDVGSKTIRIPLTSVPLTRAYFGPQAFGLMLAGFILLTGDAVVVACLADAYPTEAVVFALLELVAVSFVVACALTLRRN